jgi:hypothetical protein
VNRFHEHSPKRGLFIDGLGGVEGQELCELAAILGILMNTDPDVLAEELVELGVFVHVFRDLSGEVESLLGSRG